MSAADIKKNAEHDRSNIWGERNYFWNCHREGGDFAWHSNNLAAATGSPKPEQINAAWTFAGKWNPERIAGPAIQQIKAGAGQIGVMFSEPVTVKGKPQLTLRSGGTADYVSGSGSDTLLFTLPPDGVGEAAAVELNGGAVVACEASAALRVAEVSLP